jgi:hypothetical protein
MKSHGVKGRTLGVVKLTPEEAKVRIGGLGELGQLNLDVDLFVLNSASALNAKDMNVKLLKSDRVSTISLRGQEEESERRGGFDVLTSTRSRGTSGLGHSAYR